MNTRLMTTAASALALLVLTSGCASSGFDHPSFHPLEAQLTYEWADSTPSEQEKSAARTVNEASRR